MAQNFLYMFEFVVDNLLVTRMNKCAPEEYPTCCEISFRSSVYVSICDREYGKCVDTNAPKCGKCVLFSLESPINNKDRLLIHVYKKKTDNCKFLLGATEMPVKPLFEKVTDDFDVENPNWMEAVTRHHAHMPDPRAFGNKRAAKDQRGAECCDDEFEGRHEQFNQTAEVSKGLLPLFNIRGEQTGNLTLIVRLVCNGPAIVTISSFCARKPKTPKSSRSSAATCCGGAGSSDPCKRFNDASSAAVAPIPDPQCRRYFATTAQKGCPCDECEDDIDRAAYMCCEDTRKCKSSGTLRPKERSCGGEDIKGCECCDDFSDMKCDAEDSCPSDDSDAGCEIQPCYTKPTRRGPGPDAYEEFEACLNGSGLTIRVLKDTHQMQTVMDGTEGNNLSDSESECGGGCGGKSRKNTAGNQCANDCESLRKLLSCNKFAQNALRKRTAGRIVNNPQIPKVRANIKYAGADTGCLENYRVPFTKIKDACAGGSNKLDMYRKNKDMDCGPMEKARGPEDTRSCCLQVEPKDIQDLLAGVNVDARKKGIEVCYKTCDDTESDVFLVKLGAKKACERKLHSVEIELKTPKIPIPYPVTKCTTETQIVEAELDAAFGAKGKKKKGGKRKGKKGKK